MKAKKILLLVAMSSLLVLSACGKKEETTSSVATEKTSEVKELGTKPVINPEKYVESLADYKNITYKVSAAEVSEEEVNQAVETQLQSINAYKVVDREAKDQDQVDIDYVGKKDGVAFDNGSAQGYKLVLGSNTFIDGFEAGLVGKKAGDTLELNLTFPENYPNEELKGAAVVFEVKVNSVSEKIKPELTDEFFKSANIGVNTVEEFKNSVKNQLEVSLKQSQDQEKLRQVMEALSTGSKIKEVPAELVEYYTGYYHNQFATFGQYMGMSAQDYAKQVFGLTSDKEVEAKLKELAEDETKLELILASIAKAEGLEVTEADVNAELDKYLEGQGSSASVSKEDLLKQQGGMEGYKHNMSLNKAYQFVMENAKETKK